MWIIDAPSSTARRASSAYSSGVYGIAAHWSRFATAPLIELVITTGSLKLMRFLLRSWEPADRTEVVALGRELAPGGGHLLDGERVEGAAVRAEQPACLGVVAGPQRGHDLLAIRREAPQTGHEQLVGVADLRRRLDPLERRGDRPRALEPLLHARGLLLERSPLRHLDRRRLVGPRENYREVTLVLGLRGRRR